MDERVLPRRHVGPRGTSPRRAWVCVLLLLGTGCLGGFLRVQRVSLGERLEVFLGGGGNSGVLRHGREALIIDAKLGSYTRRLARSGEEQDGALYERVRRMVLTHFHADHAQELDLFPELGAVLVHPRSRERLVEKPPAGTPATLPYVEVERELSIQLGGEELLVVAPGLAHTDGDLVALLPQRGVLFTGDIVLAGYEPEVAEGGDILAYRATLERILLLQFQTVVPGHGPVTDRRGVERYRDYFAALEEAVRAQRAAGHSADQAAAEVKLPAFDDLKPLPFGFSSREKTVRKMYEALAR